MALTRLVIDNPALTATSVQRIMRTTPNARTLSIRSISDFMRGIACGARRGSIALNTGAVQATATLTVTGAPTATETFTICGTVFTARASGAVGNEFNIGGTVTITATNIAAAVNASATAKVTGAVLANSLVGVVTFTARTPGAVGNGLSLSEALTNVTAADFSGGSEGTASTFDMN